jgi:hypothetical protein
MKQTKLWMLLTLPLVLGLASCSSYDDDIVLGPQNFVKAFDAVVKAVEDGTLTEERINQSVRRILKLKKQAGHQTLL